MENQFEQRQLAAVRSAVDKVTAEENQKFIDERFERGRLYLEQKQFTKALIEFNLALERDPANETILAAVQTTNRRQNEEIGSLVRKGRQDYRMKTIQKHSDCSVKLSC